MWTTRHILQKFSQRLVFKHISTPKLQFMSSLKTLSVALMALALATPVWATPDRTSDRALIFAECLGRFSAEREHGWLVGNADEATETMHDFFADLLESVRPAARDAGMSDAQILHHRITAKMAQARLLTASAFHHDPRQRTGARIMARRQLTGCETLLLG